MNYVQRRMLRPRILSLSHGFSVALPARSSIERDAMAQSTGSETKEMRNSVAAVVPCYNIGGRAMPVLKQLLNLLNHVIVVDDGSTDGLGKTLEGLPVQLIVFPENRGKGYALLEGFREALKLEISGVVTVDGDGQHDPKELQRLYAPLREGADLVIGSRVFERGEVPWRSRFGNVLTNALTRFLLGQHLPDTQSGFRMHSRRFVEDILATVQGGRYETEMEILARALKGGFKTVSVPIQTIYEEGNKSSHFNVVRDSFLIYRKLFALTLFRDNKT